MSPFKPAQEAANVIPLRIAEMLGKYPPFSMFSEEEVFELARNVRVKAVVKGEAVWQQGDSPADEVFFLCRGRVEYLWSHGERSELVDVRDVGDVLGLSALLEKQPFRVTANVTEDALLYAINMSELQPLLDRNDSARYYVRRHMFWVTRVGVHFSLPGEQAQLEVSTDLKAHLDNAQVIQPRALSRLLTCAPDDTIQKAAKLMTDKRVPSIVVVDEEQRPVGVLTSTDMVKAGIVDELPVATPVGTIMASPVRTVAAGSSTMVAMLYMLRERIGQVCVTEDGTPETRVLDVCTHKDLLSQSGQHPAGLIREIRAARTTARLRELCDELEGMARGYLESGISGIFVSQVFAELHDELIFALIEMATRELQSRGESLPRVNWAWIAVGSDGRREQILRTDMDNAFIFRSSGHTDIDEAHRQRFLRLTNLVVEYLVQCGFARCQGGIMAANPRWCKTDEEWGREFLVSDPEQGDQLLRLITMLDLRGVAGDQSLVHELRNSLFQFFANSNYLQRRMAGAIVDNPPPLNFWGNFIVEKRGAEEGRFDIKLRGLNPIRDATRLLAIKYQLFSAYSTGGRLQTLEKEPSLDPEMLNSAYESYDFMFRLRTLNGLRRGDSGRYIEPGSLSKFQRTLLTNAFDVQRMLQVTLRREFGISLSGL